MAAARRSAIPPLLGGALALAAAATAAPPIEWTLFLGAALLLVSRGTAPLAPFVLAGALLAAPPLPRVAEHHSVTTLVRVRTASRASAQRAVVTAVEWVDDPTLARAGDPFGFLVEPSGRQRHHTGEWLAAAGELTAAAAARNPCGRIGSPRLLATQVRSDVAIAGVWATLRWRFDTLASAIDERLHQRLSPAAAAFARTLALGRTDELSKQLRDDLKAIGAWHLLAVSGAHVVLVAALVQWCVRRLPPWLAMMITIGAVLAFALLSGGQPPALRAAIAFSIVCIGRALQRTGDTGSTLALPFLLLAAGASELLRDPGLQLSFVAVLALCVAARYGPSRSPRGSGHGIDLRLPIGRALRFALFASVATSPLTAFHFGSVAWLAPIATLALTPVVSVALVLALITIATLALPAVAAWPFGRLLEWLHATVGAMASFAARMPATPWQIAPPSPTVVLGLIAVLVALLARRPALASCIAIGSLVLTCLAGNATPPALLLLDAGHGQAALVRSGGRCDLFDAGGDGALDGDELTHGLMALGVDHLDALALSHLDADHCAFAPWLLDRFPVGEVILAAAARAELESATNGPIAELRQTLAEHEVSVRFAVAGDRIGPHQLLWPPPGRSFAARNDGCLVIRAALDDSGAPNGATALFTGDLEGYPLLELAGALDREDAVVLLPHHGNRDPAVDALIERCRPRLALASRADPLLPSETCRALAAANAPWLSTALGGAIALTVDPHSPFTFAIRRAAEAR